MEQPPQHISETEAFIHACIKGRDAGTDLVWALLANGAFVGCCGFHNIQSRKPHFGLWVKEAAQGMGRGSDVVAFMLPWGLRQLEVDFIRYPVDERNTRSIRIIGRLGAQLATNADFQLSDDLQLREYRVYPE